MSKRFLIFGILATILVGLIIPAHVTYAASWFGGAVEGLVELATKAIASILMSLSALFLALSGLIFDWVVETTIIKMGVYLQDNQPIGKGIVEAWKALRDVANMCFIFVLLYVALKAMFQLSFGSVSTSIRNIVIVALLINFSLFFSKVVIDASNIVSTGFYNSITSDVELSIPALGGLNFNGISGGYMKMLGLSSLFSADILDLKDQNGKSLELDAGKILIIGIMTSVLMLVTAIVLLISGIMFAARFVVLIFLMILSPLALIAFIIPKMSGKFHEWLDALVNQAFFAPLFFALTYIVFKVGKAVLTQISGNDSLTAQSTTFVTMANNPGSTVALVVNYVLVIGLAIAALIFAKSMATKGAAGTALKAVSGGIAAGAIGGAAWGMRNSIGRKANKILNDSDLKDRAAAGNVGARMKLATANKLASSSFDVRGLAETKLGKKTQMGKVLDSSLIGKTGGKDGFAKSAENKAKRQADYAKKVYGQTDEEKERASELENEYKNADKNYKSEREKEEVKIKEERNNTVNKTKNEKEAAEKDLEDKKAKLEIYDNDPEIKKQVEEAEQKLKDAIKKHEEAITKQKSKIEEDDYSDAVKILKEQSEKQKRAWEEIKNSGAERMEAYAKRLETPIIGKVGGATMGALAGIPLGPIGMMGGAIAGYNAGAWNQNRQPLQERKAAARAVRKQKKGKSLEEEAAEIIKKMDKKKKEEEGKKDEEESKPEENKDKAA